MKTEKFTIQNPITLLQKEFQAPTDTTLIEVAQIIGHEIYDIRHFRHGSSVSLGNQIGHQLSFAGRPLAFVPKLFIPLSWLMYPLTRTKQAWKSDFYSSAQHSLVHWSEGGAVLSIPTGWTLSYIKEDGSINTVDHSGDLGTLLLSLSIDQHVLISDGNIHYSVRYVSPQEKMVVNIFKQIDPGAYGIAATLLLSFMSVMLMYANYTPPPAISNEGSSVQIIEAMLLLDEAPEPKEEVITLDNKSTVSKEPVASNPSNTPNKKGGGKGIKKGPGSDKIGKKVVVDNFVNGLNLHVDGGASLDLLNTNLVASRNGSSSGRTGSGSGGTGSLWGKGFTTGGEGSIGDIGSLNGNPGGRTRIAPKRDRKKDLIDIPSSDVRVMGSIDRSLISKQVNRHMAQIRYCYERELQRDPSLSGKVTVRFVIDKDGSVSKANIQTSSLGSKKVENCVKDRFLKFKFPVLNGIVIVKYPFIFNNK